MWLAGGVAWSESQTGATLPTLLRCVMLSGANPVSAAGEPDLRRQGQVGLGSDFDGAKMPSGLDNAAELQNLGDAMRARGFDQLLIEKVCFKNWLRVLGQTWRAGWTAPEASAVAWARLVVVI